MGSTTIRYFIPKLRNRLAAEKNRIWKHCNVEHLSLCGYTPFKSADVFKERLHVMLGAFSKGTLEGVADVDRQTIIDSADQAMRHEFDLLGSGDVKLDPIDWHYDFKSDHHWPQKYYRELGGKSGADIKVPWELSRCQHLLWLGEAYLLTGEKKYAKEVIDEIDWWIEDNPLMYSVNWKCAMDVAFRAVNWMYALNMITGYNCFDDAFADRVSKSLWQHGFFIRNNLEKQIPYSNNHYASDIVGLLYLGSLFQYTRKGKKWFRFALKEYYTETQLQVLPSGVQYERSISYHRLMTELLSYPVYMLKRIGISVPFDIMNLIRGMYAFVANYTKPNGYAPLIADNDNGRFAPFLKRDFREHNYLNDERSVENRFITSGGEVIFHSGEQQSEMYSDAGFVILRNENSYLFVTNGGYSKHPKETDVTIGTHTHNDLLSFEYVFKGKDIVIDPGTYLYTSSPVSRNEFRSTSKHNTVLVDNEEQNYLPSHAMFSVNRNVHIGQICVIDRDIVKGTYVTIKGGLLHERTLRMNQDSLIIIDHFAKKGKRHKATITFNLAEDVRHNENVVIQCSAGVVEFIDTTWSPSYGVLRETHAAIVHFEFDDSIVVETHIKPCVV